MMVNIVGGEYGEAVAGEVLKFLIQGGRGGQGSVHDVLWRSRLISTCLDDLID